MVHMIDDKFKFFIIQHTSVIIDVKTNVLFISSYSDLYEIHKWINSWFSRWVWDIWRAHTLTQKFRISMITNNIYSQKNQSTLNSKICQVNRTTMYLVKTILHERIKWITIWPTFYHSHLKHLFNTVTNENRTSWIFHELTIKSSFYKQWHENEDNSF